jgi:hypothetical protein
MNVVLSGLTGNWHFIRIVRLLFALTMLASFISTGDKVVLFGAVFFGCRVIFNIGCCGTDDCYTRVKQAMQSSEIDYEEVKAKE